MEQATSSSKGKRKAKANVPEDPNQGVAFGAGINAVVESSKDENMGLSQTDREFIATLVKELGIELDDRNQRRMELHTELFSKTTTALDRMIDLLAPKQDPGVDPDAKMGPAEKLARALVGLHTEDPDKNFGTLEDFITAFLEYMQVSGLTDSESMAKATSIMSLMLREKAKSWFYDQRSIQLQRGEEWSLDQVVVAMRQRFIPTRAKSQAMRAFEATRLGAEGVAGLETGLQRLASYLVEAPSDYTLRVRFMDALPDEFREEMIRLGFNAEECTWDELIAQAANIEAAQDEKANNLARGKPRQPRANQTFGQFAANSPAGWRQDQGPNTRRQFDSKPRVQHVTDKPLPQTPVAAAGANVNKAYATPPARQGAVFNTSRQDQFRPVRGNLAAVESEHTEEVEYDARELHAARGALDGEDPNEGMYEYEDTREDQDPTAWVDHEESYERVVWAKAGRIVPLEDEVHTAVGQVKTVDKGKAVVRYRHASREMADTLPQPKRAPVSRRFFEGFVRVGDIKAYTLIDTGTDTDMVSSEFAQAAKVKTFRLDTPVGLQMACIGSRSKINYGARTDLAVGKLLIKNKYLDIANIDRYDMILGVPFLWEAKAILDFSGGGKLSIYGMDFTLLDSDFAVNTAVADLAKRAELTGRSADPGVITGTEAGTSLKVNAGRSEAPMVGAFGSQ